MCSNWERQQIQNIITVGVVIVVVCIIIVIVVIHLLITCHRGFYFSEHAPKTSQDQGN